MWNLAGDGHGDGKVLALLCVVHATFVAAPVEQNFVHGNAAHKLCPVFTIDGGKDIAWLHGAAHADGNTFLTVGGGVGAHFASALQGDGFVVEEACEYHGAIEFDQLVWIFGEFGQWAEGRAEVVDNLGVFDIEGSDTGLVTKRVAVAIRYFCWLHLAGPLFNYRRLCFQKLVICRFVVIEATLNDALIECAVFTLDGANPQRFIFMIIIEEQLFEDGADQLLADAELFIGQLPGVLLINLLGMQGGGDDGEELFANDVDTVLSPLIITHRLAADEHGVEDAARQGATGVLNILQFFAHSGIVEFGAVGDVFSFPLAQIPRDIKSYQARDGAEFDAIIQRVFNLFEMGIEPFTRDKGAEDIGGPFANAIHGGVAYQLFEAESRFSAHPFGVSGFVSHAAEDYLGVVKELNGLLRADDLGERRFDTDVIFFLIGHLPC